MAAIIPEQPSTALNYAASPQAPTRARYVVLAFLCSLALLLYIDRVCIGQAAGAIQAEFGLSKDQMGWIFNAFTLAYCLFEVPTGHWGDRNGSRGVIARIAIWWSIFTAMTGAAFGFGSLLAIRFLFGAGEAGAYPNTARVVTRWFPPHRRGFARGSITFVSLIGAAVSPVLAAHLIQHVGWRGTFAVFGTAGVAWAIGFYWWFRDGPAEHPSVNAAERALIGIEAVQLERARDPIPWPRALSSPNLWLLGAIMGVNSIIFYMQFQWYPTYLKEARGQGEISSGWLTGIVMAGGAAGCIAGGLLSDIVMRRTSERKWSHRLCGGGALLLAARRHALQRGGVILHSSQHSNLVVRGGSHQLPSRRRDVGIDELPGRLGSDGDDLSRCPICRASPRDRPYANRMLERRFQRRRLCHDDWSDLLAYGRCDAVDR
jgi:MFS transporter, ACS family, glucarate transporter